MVAETGSVLQAAKRLGVNHATVLRHVSSFETRHGERIFEKTAQGYRVLPDRAPVIRAAQQAASALNEVSRLASGGLKTAALALRITSTDTLSSQVLPQFVSSLSADFPDVAITLESSNAHQTVSPVAAHVAVRPTIELPQTLIGDKVATLGFGAYSATSKEDDWLGLSGALSRSVPARWMAETLDPKKVLMSADSFLILRELAAHGHGIAPMPCFIGNGENRLIRRSTVMPDMSVPLWVAQSAETTQSQAIRVIILKLKEFLSGHAALLAG